MCFSDGPAGLQFVSGWVSTLLRLAAGCDSYQANMLVCDQRRVEGCGWKVVKKTHNSCRIIPKVVRYVRDQSAQKKCEKKNVYVNRRVLGADRWRTMSHPG